MMGLSGRCPDLPTCWREGAGRADHQRGKEKGQGEMTEQEEIIGRLQALELREGGHEGLGAICMAIYKPFGGWTQGACEGLRKRLVRLLGEADAPTHGGRITDELREYATDAFCVVDPEHIKLCIIADRIDVAYEEALREAYARGCEDGMGEANAKDAQAECLRGKDDGYDEGYASADDWCAQHEGAMNEHGWYRAVDADEQVIHADDELFWEDESVGHVTAIGVGKRAGYVWTLPEGDMVSISHMACAMHHRHTPTVEDVLHEFICDHEEGVRDEADLIAEYAAKLRLARSDAE